MEREAVHYSTFLWEERMEQREMYFDTSPPPHQEAVSHFLNELLKEPDASQLMDLLDEESHRVWVYLTLFEIFGLTGAPKFVSAIIQLRDAYAQFRREYAEHESDTWKQIVYSFIVFPTGLRHGDAQLEESQAFFREITSANVPELAVKLRARLWDDWQPQAVPSYGIVIGHNPLADSSDDWSCWRGGW